jgi:hypothetical protein
MVNKRRSKSVDQLFILLHILITTIVFKRFIFLTHKCTYDLKSIFFPSYYIDKNVVKGLQLIKYCSIQMLSFFFLFLSYSTPKIEKLTTFEKYLNYEDSWCLFLLEKDINNVDNNRKFYLNQGRIDMSFNIVKLHILFNTSIE